ncbi:MAG: glycine cleavage system protein GcvH [candidate division WOR-3 bacterium]
MSKVPENLKYSKTHEWVRVDGDIATVGITDFAQQELSDIVFVEITALGQKVQQSDSIGIIEAVKAVADLYAPVSGEVVEANDAVKATPALVNSDPYGQGWLAKIRLTNSAELESLLGPAAYAELAKRSAHH